MTSSTPFLMFQGRCEEALEFYAATIPGSGIESIDRYGPAGPGEEGSVRRARAIIAAMPVFANDSPVRHDFTFTPSISFMVECADEDEIDRLAAALSDSGEFLMPLANYGFSRKFAWVKDRFGISWQLLLP